jgi:hypothetical protein
MGNLIPEHLTKKMNNFECKELGKVADHVKGWTEHGFKGIKCKDSVMNFAYVVEELV